MISRSECPHEGRSTVMVGGMEVDLCEDCAPLPTATKRQEGPYDEFDYDDE